MPKGLQQTKPMPSSSHKGSTWASGPRQSMEYSFWMAASGCTAWARRTVCRPGSDRPNCDALVHRLPDEADGGRAVKAAAVRAGQLEDRMGNWVEDRVDVGFRLGSRRMRA